MVETGIKFLVVMQITLSGMITQRHTVHLRVRRFGMVHEAQVVVVSRPAMFLGRTWNTMFQAFLEITFHSGSDICQMGRLPMLVGT